MKNSFNDNNELKFCINLESEEIKQQLKEAYQALLIFSLNQPLGDFYKNFSDEVKQRALKNYGYEYNEAMVS